jgi:single-stranded-DNA-specific exonuclease
MQEIVTYLLKAIGSKKKIMVYGDYDVDGICSVSILKRMFNLLDTNIGYYIPSRYKDGYGINTNMVEEIAKNDKAGANQKKAKKILKIDE